MNQSDVFNELKDDYFIKRSIRLTRSYEIIKQQTLGNHKQSFSVYRFARQIKGMVQYQFLHHYAGNPPVWRMLIRSVNKNRPLPEFAVVGPIKSGSSDLATHLMLHPSVLVPLAKEIRSPEPRSWHVFYPTLRDRQQVEGKYGVAISGYFGPFMHWMRLIDRYHACQPGAKIIILLRDPVRRAFSHWKWDLYLGGHYIKDLDYYSSFEKYIDVALELFPNLEMDSICGFPLLESGIYYKAVERWINCFGRERILVIPMESYFKNRGEILSRIQKFLDLEVIELDYDVKPINTNPLRVEPMGVEVTNKLREFYHPYNQKLSELLGENYNW